MWKGDMAKQEGVVIKHKAGEEDVEEDMAK
jgi:hypothetical protein